MSRMAHHGYLLRRMLSSEFRCPFVNSCSDQNVCDQFSAEGILNVCKLAEPYYSNVTEQSCVVTATQTLHRVVLFATRTYCTGTQFVMQIIFYLCFRSY